MRRPLLLAFLSCCALATSLAAADPALATYKPAGVLAKGKFSAIASVSVASNGTILIGGDKQVIAFSAAGKETGTMKVDFPVSAVAVDAKNRIFVGGTTGEGKERKAAFAAFGPKGEKLTTFDAVVTTAKSVSGLATHGEELVVFDTAGRAIHHFGADGKLIASLGKNLGTCCGILDGDVAADGSIFLAHLGAHRVDVFDPAGNAKTLFGTYGKELAQFTGCCNPVSLALTADGNIVTTEKTTPRVKVYKPDGTLLAAISEESFSPACGQMDVAVDAKGNIYVADDGAQVVKVFSPAKPK
jgi:sugar lactone lactonase YvrE